MANALEQYLAASKELGGFRVPDAPDLEHDSSSAAIVEFGVRTIVQAVQALPSDVRERIRDALLEALAAALANLEDDVGEIVEDAAATIPIVGQIIQLLLAAFRMGWQVAAFLGETGEDMSRAYARLLTIDGVQRPYNFDHDQADMLKDDSYFESMRQSAWTWSGPVVDQGYLNYNPPDRPGTAWSWEPAFDPPMTLELTIFGGMEFHPKGRFAVNTGVPMTCGSYGPRYYWKVRHGCDVSGTTSDAKDTARAEVYRDAKIWVEPLWWPAWCPSYPTKVLDVYADKDGNVIADPNRLLIERQIRILTNVKDNFSANLDVTTARALGLLERVVYGIEHEALPFCELENGKSVGGICASWVLDASDRRGKGWEPGPLNAFFFINAQGIVEPYFHPDSPTNDLANWGFAVPRDGPTMRWLSFADLNSIVGNTRAAWTARRAFLADNLLCKVLHETGWLASIEQSSPELYAAAVASGASASPPRKGSEASAPGPRKPGEPAGPRRPGEGIGAEASDGDGAGLALVGLGVAGWLLSRRRRR